MHSIDRLLALMATLRDPQRGCPWDREQTFATIAPYTVEEAYEVADAIERDDMGDLVEELGDLLFQVVFHARMAEERKAFDFQAVAEAVVAKMIRRHPHVFGDAPPRDGDGQIEAWEALKEREREARSGEGPASVLDGVARTLPPMTRALKIQRRAARVGFDWTDPADILGKVEEELGEVAREVEAGAPRDRMEDEIGDLLFVCVNLARRFEIDPEAALKRANGKFERRFHHIERALRAVGRGPAEATLDEMEALWGEAKHLERTGEKGTR